MGERITRNEAIGLAELHGDIAARSTDLQMAIFHNRTAEVLRALISQCDCLPETPDARR